MKKYIKTHPWKIIEEGFHPNNQLVSESLFSLGNGSMGHRANFEEDYSGDSLKGTYIAGIYYPDKTKVGWWKNGYPEYFAKVLNAPSWINISCRIGDLYLDIAKCKVESFSRVLDMQHGYLQRSFVAVFPDGRKLKVDSMRFCSIADSEVGAIRYSITPINFTADATINLAIDANVMNQDSNYEEKFWNEIYRESKSRIALVTAETKKTLFQVCTAMTYEIECGEKLFEGKPKYGGTELYADNEVVLPLQKGVETVIYKYAVIQTSLNHQKKNLHNRTKEKLAQIKEMGFNELYDNHKNRWLKKWESCDIVIEGDISAQQGIRFNIFQLTQTYSGEDERLNIGPKGFTGEKYGGSTYWDTEAYCIPFYLGTAKPNIAKSLLVYRYRHLGKAIENAKKLGFENGAALFPMVTMNGEECHNEWEITFEEIHRNGAIAFAIFDYVRYTEDQDYLVKYGLEVLIAISRFWCQRVSFSASKNRYVMLGVTGPNEYENNVNNNWYTNYIARWTLKYSQEVIAIVKEINSDKYEELVRKLKFEESTETKFWANVQEKMFLPVDLERKILLQQELFLDKELISAENLKPKDRPLNQKWSWDRILRSCFIKQADVLQGLFLFEEDFSFEEIKRNFDFYEPMTVHESSLSPCVHSILATKLGYQRKAYSMYLRTARLDLDNYNNDTEDGCHITSMAGTWMSLVKGFGGMIIKDNMLHFNPVIPSQWESYSFRIEFRGRVVQLKATKNQIDISLVKGNSLKIMLNGDIKTIKVAE